MTETKLETPKSVMLFSNGNTACFDKNGQQIGELQKGWLEIWLEWLESKDVNPLEIEKIETIVNGRNVILKPFRTDNGWNCEIINA